ncbi:MAG: PorV/PorQ family protein [candidate division FCPU426 bacterium]
MRNIFIAVLVGCLPLSALAISGKGTTAATFLKISVGPRAVAMGEAYAGLADDATALYWNPAGLAQITTPEATAMHVFWLEDIFFDHVALALPWLNGTIGGSLVYLNAGDLVRSDIGDTPDDPGRGTFSAADFGFTAGYGLRFSEHLHLGANVLMFSETIDAQANLGWAVDAGFLYFLPWPGLRLGGVVQHLGPATSLREEYYRLPINFKLGAAYLPLKEVALTLDYNQLLEQPGKIALGAEYLFAGTLALRAGYMYQEKIDPSELYANFGSQAAAGVTAGLGLRYAPFRLDYAFVPYGFFGTTHRISMTYQFAAASPAPTPTAQPTAVPTPVPTPVPQRQALEERIEAISRRIELGQLVNIQFKSGSTILTPESLGTLDEIAAEAASFPDLRIRIEGHTDAQGSAKTNLRLSQSRVQAVQAYLVDHHRLLAEQFIPVGYGESRPIADNATAEGRRRNRRVEFKVVEEQP